MLARTTTLCRGLAKGRSLATDTNVASLAGRSMMAIDDFSPAELRGLLAQARALKAAHRSSDPAVKRAAALEAPLAGDSVAMIFQKRSTRTRVSSETGMALLGGHALFLGPGDVQLGVNETMRDTANVLSNFNSLILARVFGHDDVAELDEHSSVPVINALSHLHHPLQTLADLMALQERFGEDNLAGKTVAWVGDGNNVLVGCAGAAAAAAPPPPSLLPFAKVNFHLRRTTNQ